MKTKILLPALLISAVSAVCQFAPLPSRVEHVETMPPVVVKTVPEAGSKNVPPGDYVIKVTFSKRMRDQSWSWSSAWENSEPDFIGAPQYDDTDRTCSLKVKLEPNKTYGFWLSCPRIYGFCDRAGRPVVPYLLVFKTKLSP